ncbi:MAG: SBBP repeat-containing protein [Flavobacteriales bacterium]|nr:SBBP repeat-containing protein [Flavobacteriales bacterium]
MRTFMSFLLLVFLSNSKAQVWNWAVSAGDGSNVDQCYGIATDSQGNAYWAGSVRGTSEFGCGTITTGSNTAGVLAKYDIAGNCLWVRSVLVTFDDALAYDIAIDAEDRIYITGSYNGTAVFSDSISLGSYIGDDIFLARYDVDGTCLWARRAGSSSSDEARGIAVSPEGDVFITGFVGGSAVRFDPLQITNNNQRQLFVARYDSTGTVQWAKASTGNGQSKSARGISVANGRLFVTGQFSFTSGEFDGVPISTNSMGGKAYVLACDLDGNALWANSYGSGDHEGMGISADTLGNVFMVGRLWGSMFLPDDTLVSVSSNDDFMILKFDADGNYQWGKSTGSTQRDLSWSAAADGQGNAYVAVQFNATVDFFGTSLSSSGGEDIAILKLDGDGEVVWAKKAGAGQRDVPLCIHRQAEAPHQLYFGGYYWGTVTYGSTTIDDVANGDAMMISATDTTFDVSTYAAQVCPGACTGEAVAFTNGQGPFTYNWSVGATSSVIGDLCADFYIVEVNDANGQVHIDTVYVEEATDPGYTLQVQDDSLWIAGGESYTWFFNGTTAVGGDSASHVAELTGNYNALVTDAFGCEWSSDTVLVVLNVGLAEQRRSTLHAWPNPASHVLNVSYPGAQNTPSELINSAGQRVRSFTLRPGVNALDISTLESGLYGLRSARGEVVRVIVE